jgi:hypothetical protein
MTKERERADKGKEIGEECDCASNFALC